MLLSPNPAKFTVERWQFTLLAFALLALLGLTAFSSIPRSEDPHFPIPIVITNVILNKILSYVEQIPQDDLNENDKYYE